MKRARLLAVMVAVIATLALRAPARACTPTGNTSHTVVPSRQATDQVPPTLPAIAAPTVHRADESGHGCTGYCPDVSTISIPVAATDDMNKPAEIGYRMTLESGSLAPGLTLPELPILAGGGVSLILYWAGGDDAFDFTLQVVAIDQAGNESAPQTIRIHDDPGGCAIARGGGSRSAAPWLALAALLLAVRRRKPSGDQEVRNRVGF